MKSVTFSDIERVQDRPRRSPILLSGRRLATLALLTALGLPALMIVFHLLDPTAPLSYIVLPVLIGGLLPMTQVLHGRFAVSTRFDACHLVPTLDDGLVKLGYEQVRTSPGALHYQVRGAWSNWLNRDIAVTVQAHALHVTGPVPALRALRRHMEAR